MIQKSLREISWQVPESEYRADPALSYSTLARFEREGFENLGKLFERVESPSLLFGSIVDTLLTDGDKAFQEQYFVSDIPALKPSAEPVVKKIYEVFHNSYTNIGDILDSDMMPIISEFGYEQRWKPETRCKSIREIGQQYYQTMFMAGSKAIVSQEMYNKVFACVHALKESPQTKHYFADDNPFDDIERCYQLKFKGVLGGVDYRCMMDLAVVNHKEKYIIPVDLKTSSHREYDFPKSFVQWMYMIQARLYARLLRQCMDSDDYFKDFKLLNYRFVVVNNIDNPIPLVWEFGKTHALGTIEIGGQKFRDPEEIGSQLRHYLDDMPQVPDGINLTKPNSIEQWFENRK